MLKDSIIKRFYSHVAYIPETSCHWWVANQDKDGYGKFKLFGQNVRAHRIAYEIENGRPPDNLMILHSCDNPSCVNPEHLFIGTAKDNAQDRDAKNRGGSAKGTKNAAAKLTNSDISEIRKLRRLGTNIYEVAAQFGISIASVSRISNNQAWKHLK